jgi:two-component system sensor histidine kinase TctE
MPPRRWGAPSLRWQLLAWLLVPLLLLLALNAWISSRVGVAAADTAFDRLLVASADAIADQLTLQDGVLRVDLPYVALHLLESRLQERVFYRVVAPDGSTLTGYDDLPLPATQTPARPDAPLLYAADYHGEAVHLVALYRTLYSGVQMPPAVIVVAESGESRAALSRRILLEDLARQALLITAAAVLLLYGLGRGLRPLERLRDNLVTRPATDLSPIEDEGVQTEVRPLIDALNQHTARIDRLIASQQRFVADASHQMRTPLAEMRTQIDVSLRDGRTHLAQATLIDLRQGIDGLTRTVNQMLALARSDPAVHDQRQRSVVNLKALVYAAAMDMVAAARRKSIDLGFDSSGVDVFVHGNELLLHELVANLIDNAIRYTDIGNRIAVRVSGAPQVTLEVEDDGPGIADDERDRVFERFYRGRGNTAQEPGTGLGLAIVKDICDSHEASIALLTPTGGKGLLVRVRWGADAGTRVEEPVPAGVI